VERLKSEMVAELKELGMAIGQHHCSDVDCCPTNRCVVLSELHCRRWKLRRLLNLRRMRDGKEARLERGQDW
jgi:hypothetical protein